MVNARNGIRFKSHHVADTLHLLANHLAQHQPIVMCSERESPRCPRALIIWIDTVLGNPFATNTDHRYERSPHHRSLYARLLFALRVINPRNWLLVWRRRRRSADKRNAHTRADHANRRYFMAARNSGDNVRVSVCLLEPLMSLRGRPVLPIYGVMVFAKGN